MTAKMTLITSSATGQVLGAMTRSADPEGPAAYLLADGLMVRKQQPVLPIPPTGPQPLINMRVPGDHLAASTVDFNPRVIADPRSFSLLGDAVSPNSSNMGGVLMGTTKIRVDFVNNVFPAESAPMWVQVQPFADSEDQLVRFGQRAFQLTSATQSETGGDRTIAAVSAEIFFEGAPLQKGIDYMVLLLVQGFVPFLAPLEALDNGELEVDTGA